MSIRIRNKNAILELLQEGLNFEKITIAHDLKQDDLTKEILSIASQKKIPVEKILRRKMIRGRSRRSQEVLIALLNPNNEWTLKDLLNDLARKNEDPFFVLIHRVTYENNIGLIARTAFAAGANGLIFQGEKDNFLNEETLHFSTGAIARIPLVKMSIFESLKALKKNGIRTFSLQADGKVHFKEDLTGPIAFVLGGEREGLSDKISDRSDQKLSIPMKKGINSLNVGISAGIIFYEKIRQEDIK